MNFLQNRRAALLLLVAVVIQTTGASDEKVPTPPDEPTCGVRDEFISLAGSTTVERLSKAWAEAYSARCNVTVDVEAGGSRKGAARLCADPTQSTPVDIGDMSRNWSVPKEALVDKSLWKFQCSIGDKNRTALQLEVAIDAVSIIMKKDGKAAKCVEAMGGLSTDQLRWMYSSYDEKLLTDNGWNEPRALSNSDNNSATHLWSELSTNEACANIDMPIQIAGPNSDSGTFGFFREVILTGGDSEEFPKDREYYNTTGDATGVVNYTKTEDYAIAFVAYAYYVKEAEHLYVAPIQNENTGEYVLPSSDSMSTGTYSPLSRRIFMNLYNEGKSLSNTVPFIRYALSVQGTQDLDATEGYVALPLEERMEMLNRIGGDGMGGMDDPSVSNTPPTTSSTTVPIGGSGNSCVASFCIMSLVAYILAS